MQPGSIGLDDITVKRRGEDAPANRTVIEGFEETGTWQPIPSPGQSPDTLDRTPSAARSGRFGFTFSWYESAGDVRRGIFIPPGPFPLPAIGGPMFRAGQELRFKSRRQLVPVVVREVTEYFPTISPPSRPFLLVSQGDYEQYIRIMGGSPKPPQEFWVSLDDSLQRADTVLSMKDHLPRFASLKDRDAEVELAQHNPLAGGGWNGLTIISISALTLAVVLALGTYAVVSISTSRLDLTITRALGFSRSQLLASLALERIVMAVVAVAAGTTLGIWMGRWVLGFLDITACGQPVVPPMLVTVQGWLVALVMAELAVALLVAILIASLGAIKKLRAADILRAGV